VGVWGPAIFSDDTTADIRAIYRSWLETGLSDADAASRSLVGHDLDDPRVWLGLAATQQPLGRLDPAVRDRAVQIIDSGEDLIDWAEAAPADRKARARALNRLRAQLTGPQPAPRVIPPKWKHHTDLMVGDLLQAPAETGSSIWLVVSTQPGPDGTHPFLRRLAEGVDQHVASQPGVDAEVHLDSEWREVWAYRLRRRDPDWRDVGFTVVGTSPFRPDRTFSHAGYSWDELLGYLTSGTNPFNGLIDWF
jgi:hypothetical protein